MLVCVPVHSWYSRVITEQLSLSYGFSDWLPIFLEIQWIPRIW